MDILRSDAVAQAEAIRSGAITPLELVEAAIARIEELDPQLGALVDTRFDRAIAEASGRLPDGPFTGVPMLIKDAVQQSAGDLYQHGMRFLRDKQWRAPEDTELVRRYRAAGFVILGRTKVPELTMSPTTEPLAHGPARNPWNTAHSTGGSSGGSAAAVSSEMVAVAHGNDMGGSIRIPASCCGLVGLKPSRHRNTPAPRGAYWGPLTHEHVLTRTVRDSAGVLDCTAGPVPGDLSVAPPPLRPWSQEVGADAGRLRIALLAEAPPDDSIDPECAAAAEHTARLLESLGHFVEPRGSAVLADADGMAAFGTIASASVAYDIDMWSARFGEPVTDLEPANATRVEHGRDLTARDYIGAIDQLAAWSRRIEREYLDFDLILTPTLPMPPPRLGAFNPTPGATPAQPGHGVPNLSMMLRAFNATGQPAVSLPLHLSAAGLPIGIQLVGHYGREDLLLRVASQLETASPWSDNRPQILVPSVR